MSTHIVIPDTQVRPGVPIDHLGWIGQYIVDKFAGRDEVKIIHLGDHADMPSLSSYDKGKKSMEGRRYMADIDAANRGFELLNRGMLSFNEKQERYHQKLWKPELHMLLGNHEDRIDRATELDAQLDGIITTEHLNYALLGWTVHPFLKVLWLDGIAYSHYFYMPLSGRPYGSLIETRLRTIGHSFTMGHQQVLLYGIRYVAGRSQHGLVAGSAYLHDEAYKGYQGNDHWRGIVVCHEVEDGSYDPMFVSLNFLCKKYEGVPLTRFTRKAF